MRHLLHGQQYVGERRQLDDMLRLVGGSHAFCVPNWRACGQAKAESITVLPKKARAPHQSLL
jgi:hypothetical protein